MAALVETMAYAYRGTNADIPWHGFGTQCHPDTPPADFLKKAGLDWDVVLRPSFITFKGPNDQYPRTIATGDQALVRETDGKVLTNVSGTWFPVQNSEAFDFFNEFVAAGDMTMETGGSLRDGKMVWAMAKVSESFEVFGHDKVDSYMLFSNPHEYGKGIDIRFTPVRVVCNNTLTLALATKGDLQIKLSHRKKFDPEMVKEALGIAHERLVEYRDMAKLLGSKKAEKESVVEFFQRIFPHTSKEKATTEMSKVGAQVMETIETQPGNEFARGSWWQVFNSVTYATDHTLGKTPENRLWNAWYGAERNRKLKAMQLATEYAARSGDLEKVAA
jgi:phage/plasmid-like protein (TIGR03299 family)